MTTHEQDEPQTPVEETAAGPAADEQLREAQDRLLRVQAELENFRKRSRREYEDDGAGEYTAVRTIQGLPRLSLGERPAAGRVRELRRRSAGTLTRPCARWRGRGRDGPAGDREALTSSSGVVRVAVAALVVGGPARHRHGVALVEPAAEVDEPAAVAAEGDGRRLHEVHGGVADGALGHRQSFDDPPDADESPFLPPESDFPPPESAAAPFLYDSLR